MTTTPADQLTYEQAVAELEELLQMMQSDQCGIDKLASMTSRAAELLAACRKRLTTTEEELAKILSQLEKE